MRTRYRIFINVSHWDNPSKLLFKHSIPSSLKGVESLANLNSDKLPKDFPYKFRSALERLSGKKSKRSEGFHYKVVINGCVSFDGKPFGGCTGTYLTSGKRTNTRMWNGGQDDG